MWLLFHTTAGLFFSLAGRRKQDGRSREEARQRGVGGGDYLLDYLLLVSASLGSV